MNISKLVVKVKVFFNKCIPFVFFELNYFKTYVIFRTPNLGSYSVIYVCSWPDKDKPLERSWQYSRKYPTGYRMAIRSETSLC